MYSPSLLPSSSFAIFAHVLSPRYLFPHFAHPRYLVPTSDDLR